MPMARGPGNIAQRQVGLCRKGDATQISDDFLHPYVNLVEFQAIAIYTSQENKVVYHFMKKNEKDLDNSFMATSVKLISLM